MSRKIKFRAWGNKANKFVTNYSKSLGKVSYAE